MQDFPNRIFECSQRYCREMPSLIKTYGFVDHLVNFLFPLRHEKMTLQEINEDWKHLQEEFGELLRPLIPFLEHEPDFYIQGFFSAIPQIHCTLLKEAEAFTQFDPAANCTEEVILCYPGFYAIVVYRLANQLYRMKIPVLPRSISECAHSRTGIDINPGATIGTPFFIDHGTGIVIGETTEIGNDVKIYQGVTLGALYVEKDLRHTKRHPTIEDRVIIYAGSTILGGNTVVGHDTTIGGNVWLTESVAPHSVVYRKAEIVIKDSIQKKNGL